MTNSCVDLLTDRQQKSSQVTVTLYCS